MKSSVESSTDYTVVFITFVCIPLVRYWLSELSKQTEVVSSEKILKDATTECKIKCIDNPLSCILSLSVLNRKMRRRCMSKNAVSSSFISLSKCRIC